MNLLIISYSDFPNGDAGAVRQEAIAKLFDDLGYNVYVVAMGKNEENIYEIKKYKQIQYTSIRKKSSTKIGKIINYFGYNSRLKKFINKKSKIKFDSILLVDAPIGTWRYLKRYCKKNKINLLHDCVEWYSPEQFKLGKWDVFYRKKDYINKYLIDKSVKVLAISTYLEEYFSNKGIKTIRIPVIMDTEELKVQKQDTQKINYMYAGSPGKKDYLTTILKGFCLLNEEELNKINILIYGINDKQINEYISEIEYNKIKSCMVCFGKVDRKVIIEAYKTAAYTILMRDENLRYAKAGFPTKVVESLVFSTPIITNLTSDLKLYLKNKYNSFVVENLSEENFAKAIKESLEIKNEERIEMKNNARITAEENFDYRNYIEKMQVFMEEK